MKKNFIVHLILTTIFLFSVRGEAFGYQLKEKDDLNREIEFFQTPQRIVSLAPTHTEILFALGLGDNIVGVSDYCNYPSEAKEKQKIGGFANPDIDKILALNPDLILAFGTIQKPIVKKLEVRGQKVFWVYPHTVKDILNLYERLGEITGTDTAAKRLRKRVEEKIKSIEGKIGNIPEEKRPSIFRVMGLYPPGTIGGNSFQTDVFYLAGGRNIFADIKKDFFQINMETLINKEPDVIIICGENTEELKQQLKNQKEWNSLKAVKEDRIFIISCDLICRPGPRLAETVEKIAGYLYPQMFSIYPQRIISLGPSLTEDLYLLGVEDRLVANTTYCKRPPEAEKKEKIGSVIEVNIEKIVSLEPDLILTTSLTNSKKIEKLKNLGIKVVDFPYAHNFSQLCDQFLELGQIVGRKKGAEEIVRQAECQVASINTSVEDLPKPKVFIQVGARPLFTAIEDSFIHNFIEFAGGINIASGVKSGLYSREKVLSQNPDVILIVTMGIVGEEEKEIWEKYGTLNAVKNSRIHIVDSNKVCSPTPISFVMVLREILDILHPGKGNK
jgi:iron complex transport system substrate-binding protein